MYAYALSTPSHRSLVWSSCDMVSGPYRITQYKLMRMYVDISSCECMYIYMSDRLTRTTDEKRGNDVYTNARNPGSQALARCVCFSFCSRPPSTAEGGCLNSLNTLACVPSSLQILSTVHGWVVAADCYASMLVPSAGRHLQRFLSVLSIVQAITTFYL